MIKAKTCLFIFSSLNYKKIYKVYILIFNVILIKKPHEKLLYIGCWEKENFQFFIIIIFFNMTIWLSSCIGVTIQVVLGLSSIQLIERNRPLKIAFQTWPQATKISVTFWRILLDRTIIIFQKSKIWLALHFYLPVKVLVCNPNTQCSINPWFTDIALTPN